MIKSRERSERTDHKRGEARSVWDEMEIGRGEGRLYNTLEGE